MPSPKAILGLYLIELLVRFVRFLFTHPIGWAMLASAAYGAYRHRRGRQAEIARFDADLAARRESLDASRSERAEFAARRATGIFPGAELSVAGKYGQKLIVRLRAGGVAVQPTDADIALLRQQGFTRIELHGPSGAIRAITL